MEKDFLNEKFEIKDYYPFLNKARVQLECVVEILNVSPGVRVNRPIFLGKFPFGSYKFDLSIEEMQNFIVKFGNIPQSWIGIRFQLKASPYKKGLRLHFSPINKPFS